MLHRAEPGLDLPKPLRPRRPGRMRFSFHRFGDVSTLCLRCGANSGREWKETILGSPPDDPLKRLLIRLGRALGRLMMSMGRQHRHHTAEVGRADLRGLLSDTPFHVHGLKGQPMRLRLGTVHWNSRGRSGVVDAVTLGYVAGDVQQPERKLQLEQAAGVDSRMRTLVRELQTIASLVGGYSPRNQRDSYLRRGNVLKYWNLERVYRAPRRNLVIQIDGHPVKVELVRWQEPQEVVLAHLVLKDHTVMAASVNITPTRLLFMLKGMVTLQQDREALADHEQALR